MVSGFDKRDCVFRVWECLGGLEPKSSWHNNEDDGKLEDKNGMSIVNLQTESLVSCEWIIEKIKTSDVFDVNNTIY